jgi:hypothetical protein
VAKVESLLSGIHDHISPKEYDSKFPGLTRAVKLVAAQMTERKESKCQQVASVRTNESNQGTSTIGRHSKKGKGHKKGRLPDDAVLGSTGENQEDEDIK